MLRFWKLFGHPTFFLFDAVTDGGGGGADDGGADPSPDTGAHPDFEVPAGTVGAGEDQGGGTNPAGAGRPTGRVSGAPGGDPAGQPGDMFPKHRYDEVARQRDELQTRLSATDAEMAKLKRLIGTSLGIVDPNDKSPKPLSEREKAVQARLYQLIPGLDKLVGLADKAEALASVAESMPDFDRQNKAYWGRVAKSMFDSMEGQIATLLLGEGKTVADMSAGQRARFRIDFVNWVQNDPTRVERYEALDMTLVDDFRKDVDDTVVAPLRRQYGAAAITRNRAVQTLPVGGGGGTPTRTPKPQPKPAMDEDAAADAAWANLQERLQPTGG